MFSDDSYDQDMVLSRFRGKQDGIDPIERQRSALFGDDAKPFLGTMEELSRTKRRQRQRARELLFGVEPELSGQGGPEDVEVGVEEAGPRVWVGFEDWKSFAEAPGAAGTMEPVEPLQKGEEPVDTFVREQPETDANEATSVLSHRWTLEELWGFILKLDKLEKELGAPQARIPGRPDAPVHPPAAPPPQDFTPPPDAPAPPPQDAPMPPSSGQPGPQAGGLPGGRTPEETFAEAMASVESNAINVKERKSWAFRLVITLVVIGLLGILTFGILQAIQAAGSIGPMGAP